MNAVTLAVIAAVATQVQPSFRTSVTAVRLDVSVMRGGQSVTGLTADDFTVLDNGVPQRVDTVVAERLPITVLLALDTSESMAGEKLAHLIDAGAALLDALRPDDRIGLVAFSHRIMVKAPVGRDRSRVREALQSLRAEGATALRDAVFAVLQLRPDDESRPLMLLFSDGADTVSWLTEQEAIDAVRRSRITVHTVEILSKPILPAMGLTTGFLERIADVSGGRSWSGASSKDLRDLFRKAFEEMRARYVLSYYPSGANEPGWHQLKVSAKSGDVRARTEYYVPPS